MSTTAFPNQNAAASAPGAAAALNNKAAVASVVDKENVTNQQLSGVAIIAKPVPQAVATIKPAPVEDTLTDHIALSKMTSSQLKEELKKRGLPPCSGSKDKLFERLGVPVRQWRKWRLMKKTELKQELQKRGLKIGGSKQELLERLGVPTEFEESFLDKITRETNEILKKRKQQEQQQHTKAAFHPPQKKQKALDPEDDPAHGQWRKWRLMKMPELKQELKKRGLKIGGSKQELLGRLGVPIDFEESILDMIARESNEILKKRKKQEQQQHMKAVCHPPQKKQKAFLDPEDDPAHEEYTVQCCKASRFPGLRDRVEPAGYIDWPDGGVSELYRCLACAKIPQKPNAPPIHEY
jgi:hypothetical protein